MNECPICLEIINTEMCFLTCKCLSIYHTKCIQHWLVDNNTCPTCNKFFKKKTHACNRELQEAMFYDSIGRFNSYRRSRR